MADAHEAAAQVNSDLELVIAVTVSFPTRAENKSESKQPF
jgi:hypothetical protein